LVAGLLSHPTGAKKMPLLNVVVMLVVVGVALYLVNRFIPMASSIKTILNVFVVVVVCVWLLQATGLWGGVSSYRIPKY
jgi:undecaprenyl pyrophosphate phosphatase UppP